MDRSKCGINETCNNHTATPIGTDGVYRLHRGPSALFDGHLDGITSVANSISILYIV
jgi:hypothetical protein